jgi:ubiquinone biosynthesis protein
VEGLARDLDSDLDLWKTARPYLERWMSEQLGWRSAVENLKTELPYWGKIIPQLPRLLHHQLQQTLTDPLSSELHYLIKEQRRHTWWLRIMAIALTIIVLFQFVSLYIFLAG